jgi:predicted nucleotidyltransferase
VARKNFTKDSDIDFLVNFNPKTSLLDWCSLRLDLEDLWRAISDMRNVLAHQYFEVDHEKIELVVHGSLEDLKSTVIKMLL